jgi:hypothetical protein
LRSTDAVFAAIPLREIALSQDVTYLLAILALLKSNWRLFTKDQAIRGGPTLFVLRLPFVKALSVKI